MELGIFGLPLSKAYLRGEIEGKVVIIQELEHEERAISSKLNV